MHLPTRVKIVEVGPRDGLQNEKETLTTETKVELIQKLAECGLSVIEAGSFVSPKWVPQMANSDAVLQSLSMQGDMRYPVLVPNQKGFERAIECGAREIAVFTAASETFSQRNTNCSIADSLTRLDPVIKTAVDSGIKVRGYVSCVLGCPYEGEIGSSVVANVSDKLMQMGSDEISLGDTIGVGTPALANTLIRTVSSVVPIEQLAIHFHDTYGQALANILACLDEGIRIVDTSVAGLGGFPYARGASGNVATEDVIYMLNGLGLETGVDLQKLAETGNWISGRLNRINNSKTGLAMSTNH
ncbi:MAG: hydroxymethylglutaryl-CoA lyase [Alcanivorax sp.]|nr:hydroxymethylglutaryl-CoA lyase [Alcanivorax sp.]